MTEKKVDNSFYLDANRGSGRCYKKFCKPSLTEQQHKNVVDINNIVKQYTMQGYRSEDFVDLASRVFADAKKFVDCTELKDLQQASNLMMEAEASFVQNVPAKIREQYNHDAMQFYQACVKCKDNSELRAMFVDVRNYAAPNAEQLANGNHVVDTSNQKGSDKKE